MPGHELKVESFVIKLAVEHYIIHPSFFVIVIEQEKATHKCLWTPWFTCVAFSLL